MQMYRLSMILQNNLDFFVLIQAEWLRTDKGTVSKNVYAVGACIEVFFYIPIYGDGLLFSVVFYILLDGIQSG